MSLLDSLFSSIETNVFWGGFIFEDPYTDTGPQEINLFLYMAGGGSQISTELCKKDLSPNYHNAPSLSKGFDSKVYQ